MDISDYRKDYTQAGLKRKDLSDCPVQQFEKWFHQAQDAQMNEPNAMSIATVSKDLVPSLRTVLLKLFDDKGFVFFTNFNSQKALEIKDNPQAALLFPWIALERQVRITGRVEKISKKESFSYFTSRPQGSQLGAWISPQSQAIESREFLKTQLQKMKLKFQQGTIPLPDFWGGYRVIPSRFEFWQGRTNRLHDRFVYSDYDKENDSWKIERLAP